MRLGLLQFEVLKDFKKQIQAVKIQIQKLTKKGAQFIVLPELFTLPYFCQEEQQKYFSLASEQNSLKQNSLWIQEFQNLAESLHIFLVLPFFEKSKKRYFNTALMIDDKGKIIGKYRKNHIPSDPLFYEKYYFKEGNLGYPVFETPWGKIGILICFDQWFPEAARSLALQGCSVIVCPTAIGWDLQKSQKLKEKSKIKDIQNRELEVWLTIQKSHAIANGIFWVSVNRIGIEKQLHFWGNSFVCDPFGTILNETSQKREMIFVNLDLKLIPKTREVWTFLRDRRPNTYRLK